MKSNIHFKRLIRKYEFILEDILDVRSIYQVAGNEFTRTLGEYKRDDIFESPEMEKMAEDHAEDQIEDRAESKDPDFKKLYRKIVVKCHPDKLDSEMSAADQEWYKDLYEKAVEANDTENWALLVIVAGKLEIEIPDTVYAYVDKIQEEIERLEEEEKSMMNAISWTWYHAGSPEMQDQIIKSYIKHMEGRVQKMKRPKKQFLVLGHPRTGTGWMAKLLQSWGFDVGHEVMGEDGISHWGLAATKAETVIFTPSDLPDLSFNSFEWHNVVYCVRDPKDSIPSIIFTEDTEPASLEYRASYGDFRVSENDLVNAINSLLAWDKLITQIGPKMTIRIEDGAEEFFKELETAGLEPVWNERMLGRKYNARKHPDWEKLEDLKAGVPRSLKKALGRFCEKYGYDNVLQD